MAMPMDVAHSNGDTTRMASLGHQGREELVHSWFQFSKLGRADLMENITSSGFEDVDCADEVNY